MMVKQQRARRRVEDEETGRHVPRREVVAPERVGRHRQQVDQRPLMHCLERIGGTVVLKLFEQ